MKNIIIVIAIMFYSLFIMACKSNKFKVYYIPLEVEFFVPPSREDIIKYGISFEIDSCLLNKLFKKVDNQTGKETSQEDYNVLRIMIVNKKSHDEIFITRDKVLLSLSKKKRYDIDIKFVDEILEEFIEFIRQNKLGRW